MLFDFLCVFAMRNKRKKQVEAHKKIRRSILFTLGILAVIYLSIALVFGEKGFLRYSKLKSNKAEIQAGIKNMERQNEETKKQINKLKKDPNTIEELARDQGLTKNDEIIYNFKPNEEQQPQ